jgi:hypothetical protein
MTTESNAAVSETPAASTASNSAPVKKHSVKKAPAKAAKKGAKKSAKKAPAAKADKAPAVKSSGGVKWSEARISFVKALRSLRAFDLSSAASAEKVAAKSGLSEQEVKNYGYHAQQLAQNGITRVDRIEGEGLGYYLTAKGKTVEMA